ncbi:hypothetical protein TNCV_770001, partial [Trichonephila clavipes]
QETQRWENVVKAPKSEGWLTQPVTPASFSSFLSVSRGGRGAPKGDSLRMRLEEADGYERVR